MVYHLIMKSFGETLRDLRIAQDYGLRETAGKAGISPAYLSRIERGKERPPKPEIIKTLAKILATDPDLLFKLSSSTDPEIDTYLHETPEAIQLLRLLKEQEFTCDEFQKILEFTKGLKSDESCTPKSA